MSQPRCHGYGIARAKIGRAKMGRAKSKWGLKQVGPKAGAARIGYLILGFPKVTLQKKKRFHLVRAFNQAREVNDIMFLTV